MTGQTTAPTKGNLIASKKSLEFAKTGFELLDRKRNILVREIMSLISRAEEIKSNMDAIYKKAYSAIEKAFITLGSCDEFALSCPIDNNLNLAFRNVMGVEIPVLGYTDDENSDKIIPFGLHSTNSELDKSYSCFNELKKMLVLLAEVETSVYILANAIKKTQKRANALKNILIPRFEKDTKIIGDALEEKEREEFSRLKVIKSTHS